MWSLEKILSENNIFWHKYGSLECTVSWKIYWKLIAVFKRNHKMKRDLKKKIPQNTSLIFYIMFKILSA